MEGLKYMVDKIIKILLDGLMWLTIYLIFFFLLAKLLLG